MDIVVNLSPSMLGRLSKCDLMAALTTQGYSKRMEVNIPALVGSLFHEEVFAPHITGAAPLDVQDGLRDAYLKLVEKGDISDLDSLDPEYQMENLLKVSQEWIDRNPSKDWPVKVERTELPFNLELDEIKTPHGSMLVNMVGVLDGWGHSSDGALKIVEHKTTRRRLGPMYRRRFDMDAQLGTYIWAASQLFEEPVASAVMNIVQISKVPGSNRRCNTHGTEYAICGPTHLHMERFEVVRTEAEIIRWKSEVLRFAYQYAEIMLEDVPNNTVRAQGMFNDSCQFCEFYEYCQAGRPMPPDTMLYKRTNTGNRIKSGVTVK